MTRDQFVERFVISWLAARSASIYEDQCATGRHWEAADVPVEDAECIAETVYEAWSKHKEANP